MAANSSIEWTEATWNPATGCTKLSPGCKHCYAERLASRLQAMGQSRYDNGFTLSGAAERRAVFTYLRRLRPTDWARIMLQRGSRMRRQ